MTVFVDSFLVMLQIDEDNYILIQIATDCCKMLQIAKDSYILLQMPTDSYRFLLIATDCQSLLQIATDFYKLRLYGMSCILVLYHLKAYVYSFILSSAPFVVKISF